MYRTIDGLRIQYEDTGSGEPVLLLHGWMASTESMRPISNAVEGLGMRAVSLDFPGFGASDEPPRAWGIPEYAAFTKRFIEELKIEGCDLVCHSFGGRVTIQLASEYSSLFNRLVLIDAAGIRPRRTCKWYARTYAYKLGKALSSVDALNKLFKLKKMRDRAGSEDYRQLKSDLMRQVFVKVVNLDLTPRLKHIKNPTLLIWGTKDTSTPLYMGKRMEKEIPDAGLVELEGAGHFSFADSYAQFCAVLRAYFRPNGIQNNRNSEEN